jgi:hypothetical protein
MNDTLWGVLLGAVIGNVLVIGWYVARERWRR